MSQENLVNKVMRCSEAIGRNPECFEGYFKRFRCLILMKEHELAAKDIEKTISLKDNFLEAYYDAVDCYLLLGDFLKADKIVKKFRRISTDIEWIEANQVPKIEKLKRLRAEVNRLFALKQHKDSFCLIDEALVIAPFWISLRFFKLLSLVILRRYNEAAKANADLNKALALQGLNFLDVVKFYYQGHLDKSFKCAREISLVLHRKVKSFDDVKSRIDQLAIGVKAGKQYLTSVGLAHLALTSF